MNTDLNREHIKFLLRETKRKGVENLIKYLEESDYFTAPASANYHLNIKGGLALHSINVYDALTLLNDNFNSPLPINSVAIIALLHDLCKVGIYKLKEEDGELIYKRFDNLPLGHGDKSLLIISKYIELTTVEKLLIRWHMGPYDPEFERNFKAIKHIFPYPKMAYLADDIAASIADELLGESDEKTI